MVDSRSDLPGLVCGNVAWAFLGLRPLFAKNREWEPFQDPQGRTADKVRQGRHYHRRGVIAFWKWERSSTQFPLPIRSIPPIVTIACSLQRKEVTDTIPPWCGFQHDWSGSLPFADTLDPVHADLIARGTV